MSALLLATFHALHSHRSIQVEAFSMILHDISSNTYLVQEGVNKVWSVRKTRRRSGSQDAFHEAWLLQIHILHATTHQNRIRARRRVPFTQSPACTADLLIVIQHERSPGRCPVCSNVRNWGLRVCLHPCAQPQLSQYFSNLTPAAEASATTVSTRKSGAKRSTHTSSAHRPCDLIGDNPQWITNFGELTSSSTLCARSHHNTRWQPSSSQPTAGL